MRKLNRTEGVKLTAFSKGGFKRSSSIDGDLFSMFYFTIKGFVLISFCNNDLIKKEFKQKERKIINTSNGLINKGN